MDIRSLHSWNVSPREAVELQRRLRDEVRIEPFRGPLKLIAGADISFEMYSDTVYAAIVVLDAETMETVTTAEAVVEVDFPYVPGLLSFREIPPLLRAWENLDVEPDVLVLDGQGIAHPRGLGIASHMGLVLEKPTIGCAKSRLFGQHKEPGASAGESAPLTYRGETLGCVLRTKTNVNPVFVSPGHLMDLESAVRILMPAVRGYRIPEPTRRAHLFVNEVRRRHHPTS